MFLVLSGLVAPLNRPAAQQGSPDPRDSVCAPRLQLRHPELCASYGPGAQLLGLARLGLLPPKPLPTEATDPNLGYLPWDYLRASSGETAIYASEE
ncbi:MAG TPA: hypothetical protein VI410_06170, partial [Anaerolineales bacterium]|nr:hypothetical protein [Anaerolineales bacterium]